MIPLVLIGVLVLALVSMGGRPRPSVAAPVIVPPPPPLPGTTVLVYDDQELRADRARSRARQVETERLFREAEAALIENQTELDMLQEDIRRLR